MLKICIYTRTLNSKLGVNKIFNMTLPKKTWGGNILTIKPMKQTKIRKKKKKQ